MSSLLFTELFCESETTTILQFSGVTYCINQVREGHRKYLWKGRELPQTL